MAASIHLTEIQFDELLVAVLLQACLGGSANMYRVQRINSYCFKFFVPSIATMNLILAQRSIKGRRFTLVFDHISHSPEPQTPNHLPPTISGVRVADNDAYTPTAQAAPTPSTHVSSALQEPIAAHPATDGGRGNKLRPAKVSLHRPGSRFRSFILQNYHTDVTHSIFHCPTKTKTACIWICFLSEEIKPSVLLIKNALDYFFAESDAFSVLHIDDIVFSSRVASAAVRSELLRRSPLILNGAKLFFFQDLPNAQRLQLSTSKKLSTKLLTQAKPTAGDGLLGQHPATSPPFSLHKKYGTLLKEKNSKNSRRRQST
jgi:hypothetical protein